MESNFPAASSFPEGIPATFARYRAMRWIQSSEFSVNELYDSPFPSACGLLLKGRQKRQDGTDR